MARYRLSTEAECDLDKILRYTVWQWGIDQAERYMLEFEKVFFRLADGCEARAFSESCPELKVIRCQHHYVFYLHEKPELPLVIAVLHERMDMLSRLRKRLITGIE